jgi:hypothetical protein
VTEGRLTLKKAVLAAMTPSCRFTAAYNDGIFALAMLAGRLSVSV